MLHYLHKSVRLRRAQRLIGQLQKLLRALQGFGAGAQLTLERRKERGKEKRNKFRQTFARYPVWNNDSFVLSLQKAVTDCNILAVTSCDLRLLGLAQAKRFPC